MKKVLFVVFFVVSVFVETNAQILSAWGITGGISYCNQKYRYKQPDALEKKKYLLGYNGSLFLEISSKDHVRWVMEGQYNQKGAIDKKGGDYKNRLQYVSFNNYIKIRKEFISVIPYILIGPRIDFLVGQNTMAPPITDLFSPLHISLAFGVGNEIVSYGNVSFISEFFYNPDILDAYETFPLYIKHTNFELRVGLRFFLGGKGAVCNVPRG